MLGMRSKAVAQIQDDASATARNFLPIALNEYLACWLLGCDRRKARSQGIPVPH